MSLEISRQFNWMSYPSIPPFEIFIPYRNFVSVDPPAVHKNAYKCMLCAIILFSKFKNYLICSSDGDLPNFFASTKFFSCLEMRESQELFEATQVVSLIFHLYIHGYPGQFLLLNCPISTVSQKTIYAEIHCLKDKAYSGSNLIIGLTLFWVWFSNTIWICLLALFPSYCHRLCPSYNSTKSNEILHGTETNYLAHRFMTIYLWYIGFQSGELDWQGNESLIPP